MGNDAIIQCSKCGTKNRVILSKIHALPRCGKCRSQLRIPADAINVDDAGFQREVLNETIPTAVDFWAPWCGPCRMVSPILEAIAVKYPGRIKVVKVNSDENPDLSARYNVQGIPTILLFRGGKEIDRLVGAASREQIIHFLRL